MQQGLWQTVSSLQPPLSSAAAFDPSGTESTCSSISLQSFTLLYDKAQAPMQGAQLDSARCQAYRSTSYTGLSHNCALNRDWEQSPQAHAKQHA